MLHIYPVCIEVYRQVGQIIDSNTGMDRDQVRQLERSALSVVNNVAEGSGNRGGTRRARYFDALGSARETLGNLEAAEARGRIAPLIPELRNGFNHIIGVLVKVLYPR